MEDLNIVEQLRVLQKELERLKSQEDPYIFSRFGYHWVKCKDVLQPIQDINGCIDSIDSLSRVIALLNNPHKGYGPTYPSDKEGAYQGPYRRATETLELLIQSIDALLNARGPRPLIWPLEMTIDQMKQNKGYIFGNAQNV